MKKVKLMVSALAIVAVIGGALAFKAKTLPSVKLYTSLDGTCVKDQPANNFVTDPAGTPFTQATITDANIAGDAATGVCDFSITVSPENP